MYIYNSTLSRGTSFNFAVVGNFSRIRVGMEVVCARHRVLELYCVAEGTMLSICSHYLHFVIRAMDVIPSKDLDYLAIASDSGELIILTYVPEDNTFETVLKKTYGIPVPLPYIPGFYMASTSKGIAVGSLAENHVIFTLEDNRSDYRPITVTEPRYMMFDLIGVKDRSPTFASLEVLCEDGVYDPDKYKQYLKIYKANTLTGEVTKITDALPRHGNKLIHVPQGQSHPQGIIICYEDMLTFVPLRNGYPEVTRFLPQRKNDAFNAKNGFILTSSAIYEETEDNFVVLAQSEQGDLFSIRIKAKKNKELEMIILYIDTIPVASAMCVIDLDYLFVAAEFGDNYLYEIKSLGNEKEMIPFKRGDILVTFVARKLENLSVCERLRSISPVMQAYVADFACNNLKQFIFACGRGSSSTLRLQRYGVQVMTIHQETPPDLSNAVWSVNELIEGRLITYIVVSLMTATVVLTLDNVLYVDNNNAFKYKVPTLDCVQCTPDSFIQVYHNGFRLIRNNHFTEYKIRKKCDILRCAIHCMQIALALVNKDGLYFEVEDVNQEVSFKQMQMKFVFKSTVMCMGFISRAIKAKHLVVCFENCMEIYSVDLSEMQCLTTFNLEHIPESLGIIACRETESQYNSIINIGHQDGTLQRIAVRGEKIECEYSMKLGTRPVKLFVGGYGGKVAVIALSNRAWISFYHLNKALTFAPLDYKDQIDDVAFFTSMCYSAANIVAMSNRQLYLLSVNNRESMIEDFEMRLTYTPNIFVVNPENNYLIISETDRRVTFHKLDEMTPLKAMDEAACPEETPECPEETPECPKEPPPKKDPKKKKEKRLHSIWDSLLHIFDPVEKETVFKQPLPINETAVSVSLVRFGEGTPQYLLVGVKQGLMLAGVNRESHVHVYEVSGDGKSFSLVSDTTVEDVPNTICPIEGYVLIGVGNMLCLYGFKHSTKALIRCAVEESQRDILAIWSRRNFFIVKSSDERITYGYLHAADYSLVMIHEDRFIRAVTCLCFWDDDIIYVANKKSISAVLLPYYEGCSEKPPASEDIAELMEKMTIPEPDPSTSKPTEQVPDLEKWIFEAAAQSSHKKQSTSKPTEQIQDPRKRIFEAAAQSSHKKQSTSKPTERVPDPRKWIFEAAATAHKKVSASSSKASANSEASAKVGPSFKIKHATHRATSQASTSSIPSSSQLGPSTSKASSKLGPSTSRATSSSQPGPSTSRATSSSQPGPSTSRATSSSQLGPSTSRATSSSQPGPSISRATSSSQPGPSTSRATSLSQPGPSTSRATSSSQPGPSTSSATSSSQPGPSTSRATLLSQPGPSTSRATLSFQPGPSTSRATSPSLAGPSTSRATPSSQAGPSSSQASPSTTRVAMSSCQAGPSTTRVAMSSSQAGPSTSGMMSSSQAGPLTSGMMSSSQAGPSTSGAMLSSQAGPSTSGATSSQAGPSTSGATSSQAGPSTSGATLFQAVPSTSGATSLLSSQSGPSTSRATSSSQAGPLSSMVTSSLSGSIPVESSYIYHDQRFLGFSYELITHKVAECVQSIQKTSLVEDGCEVIVYTTISGTVGVIVPFLTETPHKLFRPLEYLLFQKSPLLCSDRLHPLNPHGRDIYEQFEDDQITIDGNVCESYITLDSSKQEEIAGDLGMSVFKILQKVEELSRTKYL